MGQSHHCMSEISCAITELKSTSHMVGTGSKSLSCKRKWGKMLTASQARSSRIVVQYWAEIEVAACHRHAPKGNFGAALAATPSFPSIFLHLRLFSFLSCLSLTSLPFLSFKDIIMNQKIYSFNFRTSLVELRRMKISF